ncbi:MAG: hypothetical protein QG670_646 [Thermoproteota archaeon]|nr:hypothetical protein [Thermoproteota archaeon]
MNSILLIDDDKSILRIFSIMLKKQGYFTDTAETGEEAIEKVTKNFFDLALVDVKLPDMDGVDLLTKIQLTNPNIIKIVITGFASVEDGIRALNNGADAYLVKPVKPEELMRIIKEKLENKK